jgi:uncharacterized membrane protein
MVESRAPACHSGRVEEKPTHQHCPACSVLDEADGITDHLVYGPVMSHIRSENSILSVLRRAEDQTADKITSFAGSMRFIYVHIAWFSVWVLGNLGLAGLGFHFDRFPFGLLTLIVSLEAIFLATFVMISQNRQAARSEFRAELDFENNLRGEIWSVHIGHALGIDVEHVEDIVQAALVASRERLAAHNAE